ncbi:MAG TPA: hypothetical protein VGF65_07020, partial [Mycobacterium sp.]
MSWWWHVAGVEGVGIHTLRHSAAVGLARVRRPYQGGCRIKAVADLLGHSSIAITCTATRATT